MLRTITTGLATTLLGLVFLLGGPTIVSAVDAPITSTQGSSKTSYIFQISTKPGAGAPSTTNSESFPDVTSCNIARAQYTDNTKNISTCFSISEEWMTTTDTSASNSNDGLNLTKIELDDFKCGFSISEFISLSGCLPMVTYYVIYKPTQYFLMGSGILFDKMLDLSIKKEFVLQPFIDTTWTVVRDFSNMLFIFILIYTGINTMLFGASWQKTVLQVVVIALLINFSLFFTKVIIDAGNILATGVYNSIMINENGLSASLVQAFEPQSFLSVAGNVLAMDAIVVFLIAAVVSGYAGYIFFRAALLFLGRLIAFWFLMIVSPFALISIVLPKANVFDKWLDTLISQAFVAPLYLFLIYMIMQVVNVKDGILGGTQSFAVNDSWLFNKLFTPIIIAILLIMAMGKALKLAEGMASDFGSMGSNIAGTALGLATGGTALAGQKLIGRAALRATEKTGFKEWAAKSPIGRVAYNLTDKTANAAFDARNLPGASHLGLGKGQGGSIVKTIKEAKEADIEFGKKITMGKDGKPIKGAAEAYAEQLESGYISRLGTGGNIGAEKAAKEIKEKNKKLEKLEKQKAEKLKDLRNQLGIDEKADLESDEVIDKKKKRSEELDFALAKAEAELEQVKRQSPDNIEAHTEAIIAKKKAEREHKKFENAQAEIDKVQKEIKELGDSGKKEDKKEKKEH